ncbi:DUF5412 family protein [Planomicrobium okeanokoites]|uniref:DUF5412 family protein n=1 Tax=Planomicrobium okeanokoites TaxID=244 RepID=UPI000A03803D|nr:DUF5412 family protein [Planomicrobium okeanokoites]
MNEAFYVLMLFILFLLGLITFFLMLLLIIRVISWSQKKIDFPTKLLLSLLVSVLIFLTLFLNQYYNLNFLPKGVLNTTVSSPNGIYNIETYHFTSIYGENAKAVLVNQESGERKTIYFNWYDYDPEVIWLSNREVRIGREVLDIYNDRYDYRHDENIESLAPQRK